MRALLWISSLTLSTLATTAVAQRGNRPEPRNVELTRLTFREQSFQSDAVGRDVPFGVYLPKDYDDAANAAKRYPLIIWLHGMWEDHLRFHQRGGAEVLDAAVADGKLPPCVFVTANGGRSSMYVNRPGERWEDLITKDLLTHVEKTFRISPLREQRAIMGVSMGGMAALRIAFTQPDLFGAVGAHSSAVFAEDPEQLPERLKQMANRLGLDEVFGNPIEKEPWQKANPLCIANRADPAQLKRLHIYFDAGSDDRYGFAAGNELLHAALEKHGVPHTWRLIDGGGHSWGNRFQDQTLPYSFAFVGAMFAAAPAEKGADGAPAAAGSGEAKPGAKGN